MKKRKEKRKKLVILCSATLCIFGVISLIGFALSGMNDFVSQNIDKNAAIDMASDSKLGENADKRNMDNQKATDGIKKKEYAVYTDRVILPENIAEDMAYDMIGCLYYKGSVYTQGESYWGNEVEKMKELFDERIGEAKGTLSEWSTQEDWSTELASTYSGTVYTVKGYSEDFRLFIYSNEDGEEWLNVLDNYDGIGLTTGSDLFEERLHITDNVKKILYQTHKDWNADWDGKEDEWENSFKKLEITEEEWNEFIRELYQSPFEAIDYQKKEDFYDTELQGHLYLEMKDGLEVGIRLMDGGYVGCQNLGWYFVKMPGEIFDKIMEACQK